MTGKRLYSLIGMPFLFIGASFVIYFPVIDHFFVSDDFKVLYRVCHEQIIFIKFFFRPLSDVSIYMNYLLGGLNPLVFNSFNILIHGINGWLVYLTCLCVGRSLDTKKRSAFAIISAALFLTYPFHNEAVVWILGRGASMACLFSLLSIVSYYKIKKPNWRNTAVCLCYFISLSAFESTIFFPLIFISFLVFEKENGRSIRKWGVQLALTLVLHLLLRYVISGSVLGSYGQDFFHSGMKAYVLNMAKVGGRLVLPPSASAIAMTAIFTVGVAITSFFIFKNRLKIKQTVAGHLLVMLSGMLLISCIIPVITSISTQTSETDRILYFPSVFLCMMGGLLLVYGIRKHGYRSFALLIILTYHIFFLEKNNINWKNASVITYSILEKINTEQRIRNKGRLYFLNIPNEVNGAYVFRLGFPDALKLYGFDSSRYIAVNYLPRQDLEKQTVKSILRSQDSAMEVPPDIILRQNSAGCRDIIDHGDLKYTCLPGDHIFFWNVNELEHIPACSIRQPG